MAGSSAVRHIIVLLAVPLAIGAAGLWFYLHGGRYISTDNAYIKNEIITISSEITGRVVDVLVEDNEFVEKGQLLFRMDEQPYRIALARAEAGLASVRSEVESMKADYMNGQLEINKARNELAFRERELARARQLLDKGSLPASQFDEAKYLRDDATDALAVEVQELATLEARLIEPGSPVDAHPRVTAALTELEKARLDLSHAEIRAPADGIATQVSAHSSEYVMAGSQLFSLIDTSRVWLEANLKETDLTHLKKGQPVAVKVDTYPDLPLSGHIDSITPATGAEFSLLPAQNSSGNWVKVVQRITVRIELDNYTGSPNLASGMSAQVEVDSGHVRQLPWLATR